MKPTRRIARSWRMRTLTRRNLTALDLFQFDDGPLGGPNRHLEVGAADSA